MLLRIQQQQQHQQGLKIANAPPPPPPWNIITSLTHSLAGYPSCWMDDWKKIWLDCWDLLYLCFIFSHLFLWCFLADNEFLRFSFFFVLLRTVVMTSDSFILSFYHYFCIHFIPVNNNGVLHACTHIHNTGGYVFVWVFVNIITLDNRFLRLSKYN